MTLNRTLLLGMTTTLAVEENITKDTVQYSAAVHMCDFSAVNVRKQTWENSKVNLVKCRAENLKVRLKL